MPIRTYSLNSREAYEVLRRDPNDLWGPSRCGEPRIPPGGEEVGEGSGKFGDHRVAPSPTLIPRVTSPATRSVRT